MKKGLFAILLLLSAAFGSKLQAQYVAIPDAAFVNWLNSNGYSSCLTGNQMDTTCPAILAARTLNLNNRGLGNIYGVQFFDNLDTLTCSSNAIASITAFPPTLEYLSCYSNPLTSIALLPNTLRYLNAGGTKLNTLPAPLPDSLRNMLVGSNATGLFTMPLLPDSLISLWVSRVGAGTSVSYVNLPDNLIELTTNGGAIQTLPPLPSTLKKLDCASSSLAALPSLPLGLEELNCNNNALTSLPALPNSLKILNCGNNLLTTLPTLTNTVLEDLACSVNQLTAIPTLPLTLLRLYFFDNNISTCPLFPDNIEEIDGSGNPLRTLNTLPRRLRYIRCEVCQLNSFPNVPDSVLQISVGINNLTEAPSGNSLESLGIDFNQLTEMYFSSRLTDLNISDNPISCLPPFEYMDFLAFENTNIQCLSTYPYIGSLCSPALSTFPLCDQLYNPDNCVLGWNISGTAFLDDNQNCTKTFNEAGKKHIKLKLYKAGVFKKMQFTTDDGLYSLSVGQDFGNYTLVADTSGTPFTNNCVASLPFNINSAYDLYPYSNFPLICKPGFDVGTVSVMAGTFRPTWNATVKVLAGDVSNAFGAQCAAGISGQVKVVYSGPISYVGTYGTVPSAIQGDTLIWNIADFGAIDLYNAFSLNFVTDTLAQMGEIVTFNVTVTPTAGDNKPSNNVTTWRYEVVNSFDPNIKEVTPITGLDSVGQWLTYTVHFQNTGNAYAEYVYIRDTLDSDLDIETFELITASHDNKTEVLPSGAVQFAFININLPDSISDEPGSKGYVQYRIKLKANKPLGTEITNTASIYFDFNSPIVTNTTYNILATPLTPNIAGGQQSLCVGDTAALTTNFDARYTYYWSLDGVPIPQSNVDTLKATAPGVYRVHTAYGSGEAMPSVPLTLSFTTSAVVSVTAQSNILCSNAAPVSLTLSPVGGTLTGNGVSGNSFDPSLAGIGTHEVIYNYGTGSCSNADTVSIGVNGIPVVALSASANSICDGAPAVTLTALPVGGTYAGATVSGNSFDPSLNTVGLNTIEYQYTDNNGCADTASLSITINAKPTATLSAANNTVCDGAPAVTLTASPVGGSYAGATVSSNSFDPSLNTLGLNTIEYQYTDNNGCADTASLSITINAKPAATLSAAANAVCDGAPAITLTALPVGGSYAGATVSGNSFDPSLNTLGLNTIEYQYTDNNGCADTASLSIMVNAKPTATLSAAANAVCDGAPAVALTAAPLGGTYAGATVSGNSFDPSLNTLGLNTIEYQYTDNNGCADTASLSITINAKPAATLSAAANAVCDGAPAITLTALPVGGSYAGATVSGNSFDPSLNTLGLNTIEYQYTDNNGCADTASLSIMVNAKPAATLSAAANAVCDGAPAVTLTALPVGGSYAGATVSSNSFDPSLNTVGLNTIEYQYTDNNGCADTASLSIMVNAKPSVNLSLTGNDYCENNQLIDVSAAGTPAGGVFASSIVSGNNMDVSAPGTYAVDYTYTDNNGCTNLASASVTVNASPLVTINLPVDPFCRSEELEYLQVYVDLQGGLFSGTGMNSDGVLGLSAVGSYPFEYTYTDSNGCAKTVQDIAVVDECIGVKEIDGPIFNIYPNPASSQLTVSANFALQGNTIELYDLSGKLLITETTSSATQTINSSALSDGLYLLVVKDAGQNVLVRKRVTIASH